MSLPLYLDYNATTPVDDAVLEAMLPWFTVNFGNPSSRGHAYGWMADEAVQQARQQVADLLDAEPEGISFTSGATEALNLAIKGVARANQRRGRHLVTVATEHSAVLDAHRALEREGYDITALQVDADGRIDLDDLRESLRDDTVLLSVMWANNETGVLQPVERIYEIARERGVWFLSDATQAVAKIVVSARSADLVVCSAHKMYGPKGAGALVRNPAARRLRMVPLIDGGGHEKGLRAGTLNVPAIVGFGRAAELAAERLRSDYARLSALRDRFEGAIVRTGDVAVNGAGVARLPQTSSVTVTGHSSQALLPRLRSLALSTGSACASGSGKASHVLKAMGRTSEEALSTIRFSFGRPTTEADVEEAIRQVCDAVQVEI